MVNGDPWFVTIDVGGVLDSGNIRQAVEKLKSHQKGVHRMDTPGGPQMMSIISESGLYKLAMRSDKPQAEPFQDWIAEEVVPSIRRTGRYELVSAAPEPDLLAALNRVDARLERIEGKLDDGRQGFSAPTVRYVCEGTAKHNNCECIYCNDVVVVTKYGEKIIYELHHVDGNKANNSTENCTIPCPECHKRLTNKKHPRHISVFDALGIGNSFHLKLKQKAGQIRAPGVVVQWDFRVATQSDMGFPQTAKRER
jgi:hypothetical protein